MLPRFFGVVLVVGMVVGASAAVGGADEGDKFVGIWKGRIDSYDEIWTVKRTDGAWSINGKFRRNGAEAGSFIGTDVKEANGALTFTRKFVKKPANPGWQDQVTIVVKSEGENLSYVWSAGNQKGTRALEKYADEDKAAEDELGKFRGYWTADVATGFRVVMQISMTNLLGEHAWTYRRSVQDVGAAAIDRTKSTFSRISLPVVGGAAYNRRQFQSKRGRLIAQLRLGI